MAGFVFNVLLIARAPLQLFQAIQGSLLPHLAGLEATRGRGRVRAARSASRCWRSPGFAGAVALGLLLIGPWVMDVLFDDASTYGRWGLAARRARDGRPPGRRARSTRPRWRATTPAAAAAALAASRAARVRRPGWCAPLVDDELVRAEVGYLGAAALLCALLAVVYRATSSSSEPRRSWPFLIDEVLALDEVADRHLPRLTVNFVLLQRSSVSHFVPRTVAAAWRPRVRKLPLPSPHSRRTFFFRADA